MLAAVNITGSSLNCFHLYLLALCVIDCLSVFLYGCLYGCLYDCLYGCPYGCLYNCLSVCQSTCIAVMNVVYRWQSVVLLGDVITIFHKQDDGWWQGELNGKVGIFPASYVEWSVTSITFQAVLAVATLHFWNCLYGVDNFLKS